MNQTVPLCFPSSDFVRLRPAVTILTVLACVQTNSLTAQALLQGKTRKMERSLTDFSSVLREARYLAEDDFLARRRKDVAAVGMRLAC